MATIIIDNIAVKNRSLIYNMSWSTPMTFIQWRLQTNLYTIITENRQRHNVHTFIYNELSQKTGLNLYQSRHCAYIRHSVKTWFKKIRSLSNYLFRCGREGGGSNRIQVERVSPESYLRGPIYNVCLVKCSEQLFVYWGMDIKCI